ncbi:MAG: hypothetical protein KDC71_22415, partial [Acidobacteria bacterium]|nr:hypothetical protein [Acidobacteriota bacterium]
IAPVRYPEPAQDESAQPELDAPIQRPHPKRRPLAYGLLCAIVLALGFAGWTRLSKTAEAHQPLKAAFVPLKGNDQTAWLADGLNYALRENLRSQYRLIGWESLQDPALAGLDPQTLRTRLGTDLLIWGQFLADDAGVIVELKALSRSGTKVIRLTLDGPASFDQLSAMVQELLGGSDRQQMPSPTLSDPLLKKFLALYNQHGTSPETYLEKIDAFKEIIQQYPEFAAGHFGLANA